MNRYAERWFRYWVVASALICIGGLVVAVAWSGRAGISLYVVGLLVFAYGRRLFHARSREAKEVEERFKGNEMPPASPGAEPEVRVRCPS